VSEFSFTSENCVQKLGHQQHKVNVTFAGISSRNVGKPHDEINLHFYIKNYEVKCVEDASIGHI
jgi:hypothetical protein